jgi:hypothetical protein
VNISKYDLKKKNFVLCLSCFEQYRSLILRRRTGERRGAACNCLALCCSRCLKCPRGTRSPYCREFRGFPKWFHTIFGTKTDNRAIPLPSTEFNNLKSEINLWTIASRQVVLVTKFSRCRLIVVDPHGLLVTFCGAWSIEVASRFLEKLWSALCERFSLYPTENTLCFRSKDQPLRFV